MSIVHWFRNDLSSKDRVLTRDLISMAIADGEFTEEERLEILRICRSQGISERELMDSLRGKDINIPKTKEEKFDYIAHLINVMKVDDYCSPLEIRTLEVLGKQLGYNRMHILWVILTEIKQQVLSQDEGLKLLDCYISTAILLENNV